MSTVSYNFIVLVFTPPSQPIFTLVEKNTGGKRSIPNESGGATGSVKSKKKEYEWLKRRTETPEKK